jgi:SpoVK/Ycf46/Vps4 family AAA+-type ATPase
MRPPSRPFVHLDVDKPDAAEQRELWLQALAADAASLNGTVDRLTGTFDLGPRDIAAAAGHALSATPGERDRLSETLWAACRTQARPRLEDLAHRVPSRARWDDLVLPLAALETIREIVAQVRGRTRVYDNWGFAARTSRGLGISVLFHGPSGTGKTLAAEVMAAELDLDLFRIDLSQVVSKYIGETEKNLRRVFDAAEDGGAVLLFDEADALFGKRSEVKDSHDRYANIEVGYLLQRMEAYRGLAILTTNLKGALDSAFLRRLRFVVAFPFPDPEQRAQIWERAFPEATPTAALEPAALARLNVAGGSISNIALGAAFLAADDGTAVTAAHVLRAARSEYAKLERPLTAAETEALA